MEPDTDVGKTGTFVSVEDVSITLLSKVSGLENPSLVKDDDEEDAEADEENEEALEACLFSFKIPVLVVTMTFLICDC